MLDQVMIAYCRQQRKNLHASWCLIDGLISIKSTSEIVEQSPHSINF